MEIRKRLQALRSLMAARELDAYVIPSSDPHQSEYPTDHWKHRVWISGFNGSAGTVVVTPTRAGLWTDFRYYLAAERDLAGTGIELFRMGEQGVPDYPQWLVEELDAGSRVGFDAMCFSVSAARRLEAQLSPAEITTTPGDDLVGMIRLDRPALPMRPITVYDVRFAGQSRGEKLSALRAQMATLGADYHLISTLDDIAWLLNIRGNDVDYNPVAVAHLLVSSHEARLYVHDVQITTDVRTQLESEGVSFRPYGEALADVAGVPSGSTIVVSPDQLSVGFVEALDEGVKRVERINLTTGAKARKNSTELEHLTAAMVRDGVAMVRFIHWLTTRVGEEEITELSAEAKLLEFRSAGERFVSESFRTISGYRGHGAIVHYAASEESSSRLEAAGIYLVDSGAQYLDGTTDITRTVALGEPSEQARRDFTLVLKGHIGLATLRFPVGTTGHMIDAVCREHLWRQRMNYGHGTGHGVGFYLSVHEGPQRISQHPSEVALEPGMIISNEPGLYRTDQYGIRIENLVVVAEDEASEFGPFLRFDTVTLCPIDRALIERSMLTEAEIAWLNEYHRRVRERLLGHFDGEVASWLEGACAPL
ncbi:MAG: aminopeptidase P family protein [Spirochaetota bacterium]